MDGAPEPAPELLEYLQPYGPDITRLFLAVRAEVLGRAPEASELIYDAYNGVSDALAFSTKTATAFAHVVAYPAHVNLGFNDGASLADPSGLLQGSGNRIRHVTVRDEEVLKDAALLDLVDAAIHQGMMKMDGLPAPRSVVCKPTSGRKRRPGS